MDAVHTGIMILCAGAGVFLWLGLPECIKVIANSKVKISDNALAIEREKTEQERLKNDRPRMQSLYTGDA